MLPVTALAALALLQGPAVQTPPQTPPARKPPTQAPAAPSMSVPPPNPTPPPAPAPDKTIATINGAPLTAADLAPYLWSWRAHEVVNTLALYRGIAAEAARVGVTVTDAEVKSKYDEQVASAMTSLKPGQTLDDALDRAGGLSGLALAIRSTLLLDKIADKDIAASGFSKLSMIVFSAADDKPPTVTAAKTADAAYASLKAGKPWSAIEKQYEKNPQLAQANGSLGWTPSTALPPDVKAQVATLKPQGYTKPIAIPGGIAIIRLDAEGKDATPADLEPLKAKLRADARQTVIARIRNTSKVEFKG